MLRDSPTNFALACGQAPGTRFSKAPKTFRNRKAICNYMGHLSFKAVFSTCLSKVRNVSRIVSILSFMLSNFFVFKKQCELSYPKSARNVSGLSRNARLDRAQEKWRSKGSHRAKVSLVANFVAPYDSLRNTFIDFTGFAV